MKMKILRKGDMDQAIGHSPSQIFIRKGKAFRKLKKATVIPIAKIQDVEQYIRDYCDKLYADGYVYAGTVDVTDEDPYPIMRNAVCLHWAYDASSEDHLDDTRNEAMAAALRAAEVLAKAEHCSVSTKLDDNVLSEVTLNEKGREWRIGFSDVAEATLPASGIGAGDLGSTYGSSPYLVMMYLVKSFPTIFSMANSQSEDIPPDLSSAESQLPFDVSETVKQLGESLGLCVAPVNWSAVGESQQSSQSWFF